MTDTCDSPSPTHSTAANTPAAGSAGTTYDLCIVGAGAAGLFCAGVAGRLGLKVLLLDHSARVAEKVRIAGGGRCNFTNRDLDVRAPQKHFISENPRFCNSALSRYTPQHFIDLIEHYGVAWHEKHKGQLFCDTSSEEIIRVLLAECEAGGVVRRQPCVVHSIRASELQKPNNWAECPDSTVFSSYIIDSDMGEISARCLVVATGGLSIPQIGASDWGYQVARQFGHRIVPTRAALVPLTFDAAAWTPFAALSGLSLPVRVAVTPSAKPTAKGTKPVQMSFEEDLLFTHRGLSGPGVLQISSYWQPGDALHIDLAPSVHAHVALQNAKTSSKKRIGNELATWLPKRLADTWAARDPQWDRPINEASDKALAALGESVNRWRISPSGSEGYKKAEVTAGGVDTRELSGQTMESKLAPGLYFIGEVVDVTGWLGGYNFQWAWASAHAAATAVALAVLPSAQVAPIGAAS